MLLAGFLLRNVPVISDNIQIQHKWSSSLRSIALCVILVRAGLGLDPKTTLSDIRLLSFVIGAVSPAVVVPSMLLLQEGGYGVEKGVPTLLMAAGSFDDILAITGFNTCLGVAFSTGSTVFNVFRGVLEVVIGMATGSFLGFFIQYFPSSDQSNLEWKRAFLVLGFAVLAVFSSVYFGFPGSGGLCTLVMAFLAGMRWSDKKSEVEKIIAVAWNIFQPLLFGLIGAEVSIASLRPDTVGLCVATLGIAVLIRILTTFLMVCFAGFNIKEKIFISFAWLPKATVQAAIGSVALDTARSHGEKQLEKYGMDVLTVAFLAILITAPIGSLLIGLLGPRLLQKFEHENEGEVQGETSAHVQSFVIGAVSPAVVVPSMLLLQENGYGIEKGIPTLLVAASSMDDVVAITGFNTFLSIVFSSVTIVSEYQTLLLHIPRGQSSTCKAVAMSVAMVALVVMTLEHHLTLDKTWKKSDYSTFLELGEPAKQMGSGGESTGLPAT
ncbi:Mitochondrial sodium/hydrogen exchanger NHA2 [Cricetulus griseus]|uniref:Mitochondrial sodium/hydrogen exchanger NHA2 n=1 Tax=Cricetulus griseus TaxID=10029 RepID=G3IGR3_CRIGR|nr:Mitochondrial sodium/hydrogen exchanger NHA2 [Cricetulus griseus]